MADRIQFMESDLLEAVGSNTTFDYIVTNPPYVSTAEMARLAPEVRDQEPQRALHAGEQGTEVIARLIPQAAQYLAAGGGFVTEVSPMIADEVEQLVNAHPRLSCEQVIPDDAGHARVVQAVKTKQ